ncbi:unnamed protein product [Calicophoron daubneyi]|uniref:Glycerol kinase n=1 Tax=Calicophoron daubneyi TaxID=300641 RepID=A0AAV2TGM1_CALDB
MDLQYILAVDFGSTHACARIYSQNLEVVGTTSCRVNRAEDSDGSCELDPENVWEVLCKIMQDVLQNANIRPKEIRCVGISVQRNSFLLWDRKTSKPRSNIITWQDLRAAELTKKWNKSFAARSMKTGGRLLYWITHLARFKALASYRCNTTLACIRLKHLLDSRPMLMADCRRGSVCYGCLETWFLWRLTNCKVFCTDVSCASASGMYDPFPRKWSKPLLTFLGIPSEILPEVRPSSCCFGYIRNGPLCLENSDNLIPVTGIIGDAQAAVLSEDCLGPGQAKLTLGTGSFLDLSTGPKPRAVMDGFYPIVGWASKYYPSDASSFTELSLTSTDESTYSGANRPGRPSDMTFLLEGQHSNTGTIIEWLRQEGVFDTYAELEEMLLHGDALNLDAKASEQGAFYITIPQNLIRRHQMQLNSEMNASKRKFTGPDGILVGLGDTWSNVDRLLVARVVVESITFTVRLMLEKCRKEVGLTPSELRVNGNVASSDWLLQRLADVTGITVERSGFEESSCLGAGIAAGVGAGVWPDYATATQILRRQLHFNQAAESLDRRISKANWTLSRRFLPQPAQVQKLRERFRLWCRGRSSYARRLRLARLAWRNPNEIPSSVADHNSPCIEPSPVDFVKVTF